MLFALSAHSQHREALTQHLGHFLLTPLENRVHLCAGLQTQPTAQPPVSTLLCKAIAGGAGTTLHQELSAQQACRKQRIVLPPCDPQNAPSSSSRIKATLHLTFPGSRSSSPGAACTPRVHRTEWQHKGSRAPWWPSSPARGSRSPR